MKKRWLALMMAGIVAVSAAACGSAGGQGSTEGAEAGGGSSSPKRYSLGTSSSGGNYYLVGGGMATILNNALPDAFTITAEETGGSTANLTMIQNGEMEMGICMTSSLQEAKDGSADWTGGPMDKIRGMVALYPSWLTMYTLESSGINCLDDFNGKIIGLGSKGMAMDSVLRAVFEKRGIEPSAIFNDGHSATASAVADGQVDAAVLFYFPPAAAISELEATQDVKFIGLTEEEQQTFLEMYPFYSAEDLPAGSYKGVTEPVPTVTEWNMLATSSDVPEEDIYQLTKTLFENNPALVEIHQSLEYCTAENNLNFNVPLHAGTVRYMEEVGIEVPDELIPPEYEK